MRSLTLLIIALLGLASPALAEPRSETAARASLTVVRGLQVGTVSPMQLRPRPGVRDDFGGLRARVAPDAPAVIRVSGDPRRAYRIRAPRQVVDRDRSVLVEDVAVWSANVGDLSHGGMSRMDAQGHDYLRISARYAGGATVSGGGSAIPLAIDYE
ncbi:MULTISPECIES: hypothetical protein [Brevundimonas]|uniref:hypothetical protein n=1 Tax=Brevundimonas TaxID=41275 RepID=UPI000F03DD05|nr:hypothetical protein [Brevundimonas lutea]